MDKKYKNVLQYQYWINKGYSEEESKKKVSEIQSDRSKLRPDHWIKRGFNELESNKKISEIQSNNGKHLKEKYKEEPDKYRKINQKCKEYWMERGFSEEESKKIISKNNKQFLLNINQKNIIHNTQIQYYLNKGFSEDESIELLKERQTTFTLDKCIAKYGKDDGIKIYNDRQEKWKKKVFNKDTCICKGVSNSSKLFIKDLLNNLDIELINIAKHDKNEKFISDKNGKHYKYDFTIGKKIIEYNGDFWHCNPNYFQEDFLHPVIKLTAKEIWMNDKNKLDIAELHGYEVLVIWESDYIKTQDEILNKCIKFLKE